MKRPESGLKASASAPGWAGSVAAQGKKSQNKNRTPTFQVVILPSS